MTATLAPPPTRSHGAPLLGPRLLFGAILLVFAVWILSLPIFPTQDGPMHRYYVHVLGSLLAHEPTYSVYHIRHPLPPYLTHYGSLLVLYHLFPYDWAEKVFTCLVLLCVAGGLWLSAKEIGPSGRWASLFCPPLLLAWPLMMGFFNFTLGIGLLLVCTAFWQRMARDGGRALLAFTLVLVVLTFTHPIPLLLLIVLCGFDLALSLLLRPADLPAASWARQRRLQFIGFFFTLLAAGFPALAVDSSRTSRTLELLGFHLPFIRTTLLLNGVSPYNTRSHDLWINLYRLCLYAIFAGAMWVGGRACVRAVRARQAGFGTTLFLATILLTLALPVLPSRVNGSDFFVTRLVFLLWPAALLAASAAPAPGKRQQRWLLAAAAVCSVLTLIPAQIFIRPAARAVRAGEAQPLPSGVPGSILFDDTQDDYVRFTKQLAFDPYKWAEILPFVHQNSVALDTPWIDQKITPIQATPGGPELVDDISLTRGSSTIPPLVPGRSMPGYAEARIVRDSSFVIYSGTPAKLGQGLSGQLSVGELSKYTCAPPRDWYMLCTSRQP